MQRAVAASALIYTTAPRTASAKAGAKTLLSVASDGAPKALP